MTFNLDPPRTGKTMEMAATCLARAKNDPLSIKLKGGGVNQRSHLIIAVLLAHAHQWYNLVLTSEISYFVYAKLLGATGRLPRLYRLEVNYSMRQPNAIRDTFPASPALRIVRLCKIMSVGWYQTGNFPLLPWRQLQHLSFRGTLGDCLETLRLSPNLRVFKADIGDSEQSNWNPVHHASLRELSIETGHNSTVLEALTLPALVSLSYSCAWALPTEDAFVSLLTRSGIANSLEAFSLTFAAYTSDITSGRESISSLSIVLHYLRHIPNLSQLHLCDLSRGRYASGGTVFPENTIASACHWLCWRSLTELDGNVQQAYPFGGTLPKLKRFSIRGPHAMSCIWVAEMVMTRWRRDVDSLKATIPGWRSPAGRPARLESVEVNYKEACGHAKSSLSPTRNHSPAGERALARLRLYRSEGLRVVGNIVDEVECIECVDEEIAMYGLQPDLDSDMAEDQFS